MVGILQPVFDDEVQVVPLIKDLAVDVGMEFLETSNRTVLLGDQFLAHGRDLDVEIILGQVEIGGEELGRRTVFVPCDRERFRLVVPWDAVEVQ